MAFLPLRSAAIPQIRRLLATLPGAFQAARSMTTMMGRAPEGRTFGYKEALKLLEGLNTPVGREEYLGSPFKLPDFSKVVQSKCSSDD